MRFDLLQNGRRSVGRYSLAAPYIYRFHSVAQADINVRVRHGDVLRPRAEIDDQDCLPLFWRVQRFAPDLPYGVKVCALLRQETNPSIVLCQVLLVFCSVGH